MVCLEARLACCHAWMLDVGQAKRACAYISVCLCGESCYKPVFQECCRVKFFFHFSSFPLLLLQLSSNGVQGATGLTFERVLIVGSNKL